MEEGLIEVPNMRRIASIELISDRIEDETTILTFRHLLEKHGLGEQFFEAVKGLLADRGVTMRLRPIAADTTGPVASATTQGARSKSDVELGDSLSAH